MANLVVEREIYTVKDKEEYYGYFVRGKVRGRDVKVDLTPKNKDYDGYDFLDIIFDIAPTAELVVREEESETTSGARTRYTVYEVRNVDEDGIEYTYKLKPRAESDKSVLNVLLQQAQKAEEKANAPEGGNNEKKK